MLISDTARPRLQCNALFHVHVTGMGYNKKSRTAYSLSANCRLYISLLCCGFRMKILVRKWKCATRAGSSVYTSNTHSQHGASYIPPSNGLTSPRPLTPSYPDAAAPRTPPRHSRSHDLQQTGAPYRPTFSTPPTKESVLRRYGASPFAHQLR